MEARSSRPSGRPRDARADRAILDAALALIAERGVDGLRVDDIADRAGVGKAAIYRRYRSRDEVLVAAVANLVGEIAIPDSGSTEKDLLALMRNAVELYSRQPAADAMRAVVAAMNRDPAVGAATREGFLGARRAALREVLKRGIERGDLRADIDVELALDTLAGPLFYRLLVTGARIDMKLARGVVRLLLDGFAPDKKP